MPTLANGAAQWKEDPASGVGATVEARYIVKDGDDFMFSETGPSVGAFLEVVGGSGDYELLELEIGRVVADGADRAVDESGVAVAEIAADGSDYVVLDGGTSAAEIHKDGLGDLVVVANDAATLTVIGIGSNVMLF